METLQKLTKQTSDEANISLLRSRIDQQSELICILKRRADEYMERSMSLESKSTILIEERDKFMRLYSFEMKKVASQLETQSRLENIIISLKNEARSIKESLEEITNQNEELRLDNKQLKTDKKQVADMQNVLKELEVKQNEIKKLQKEIKANEKEYEKSSNETHKQFEIYKNKSVEELKSYQNLVHKYKEKIAEVELKLSKSQLIEKDKTKQIVVLGAELEKVSDKLQCITKQLDDEKHHTEELSTQIVTLNSSIDRPADKKSLQNRVMELESEQRSLKMQFEVYKKHAEELLQKERDLNKQMRRVRSQKLTLSSANTL